MTAAKRYCTDCRFREFHPGVMPVPRCYHPDTRDLTGRYLSCDDARARSDCGIAGVLFQPLPPAPPPRPARRWISSIFTRRPKSDRGDVS
jgi:hypothetical protein